MARTPHGPMVAGAVTDVGGVRSPSDLRYRDALKVEHSDLGQCSGMTPDDVTCIGAAPYKRSWDETLRDADRSGSLDHRCRSGITVPREGLSRARACARLRFHRDPQPSYRRTAVHRGGCREPRSEQGGDTTSPL